MQKLTPETWQEQHAEKADIRLDQYLVELFPELSRARAQKLITEGHVRVEGKAAKANHKLKVGEKIAVYLPAPAPVDLVAQNIPLKILFEDEHLLVVDKEAGMVVHPAVGHGQGTLVNALLHHTGDDLGTAIGGELRPGIVHRIDKNTSGILVVSKTDQAHGHLSEQFKTHSITRRYQGMCWGDLPTQGSWQEAIARDPKHRQRMALVKTGKAALTRYKKIESFKKLANFFEAELFTGRTHQIRVHFASHGYPLLGDPLYTSAYRSGRQKKEVAMHTLQKKLPALAEQILALYEKERQFLHAAHLSFTHPITEKRLSFDSALPEDLKTILEAWKSLQ